MTLQEAIKSGKPFRRKSDVKKGYDDWLMNKKTRIKGCCRLDYDGFGHDAIIADILATDWEIKKSEKRADK